LRETALLEEAGERGKIKSTAASSWWRVSMGARVIEKTDRIPPPPPPPPASIPARRARLPCTPMASSPSRSPHTVMLETGRGIPQAVILQTVRIWIKQGESRGGGLREPALLEEAGERGKIKSTAASSWWRVSMGARVIEKTERIPPPPPPPPASIPARRARLPCTPMASSPSRSPHTVGERVVGEGCARQPCWKKRGRGAR